MDMVLYLDVHVPSLESTLLVLRAMPSDPAGIRLIMVNYGAGRVDECSSDEVSRDEIAPD